MFKPALFILSGCLVCVSPVMAQSPRPAGTITTPTPATPSTSTIPGGTNPGAITTPVNPNQAAPTTTNLPAQQNCSSNLRSGGTPCPNALQPTPNPQITTPGTKSTP